MEFGLSSEQQLLRDTLDEFLRAQCPLARVRQFAQAQEGRARDLIDGLAGLGVFGLITPTEHGGTGLGLLDACVVAEALGHAVTPVPFIAQAVLVPMALMQAGTAEQQARWLPELAGGRVLAGAALSEQTGSRAGAGVELRDGCLHGVARYVLDFEADLWLVADAAQGLHLVRAGAPGLSARALETVDRSRPTGELTFDGVPVETLPGASAQTLRCLLDAGRTLLAADSLGAASSMLAQAVSYAGQRVQFGRVIGSFQAVKHLCAQAAADLEPTRALLWGTAHAFEANPEDAHRLACHLKAHLSEVATAVAKATTEVHGGMGFTDLVGLHYWFKRIGLNRQWLGSPERLRLEAARAAGLVA
jgi:alkylation response protein AidB-like acyl-CoA dehydrogenase